MTAQERVRTEQINRLGTFGVNHAADWTPTPPPPATTAQTNVQDLMATLNTADTGVVARLEKFETGHTSGAADFHGSVTAKSVLRDGIYADLREWNETAASIAETEQTPEIMNGFRVPHGVSAEALASTARSFAEKAGPPLEAKFIALGHDPDFIQQLLDRVDAFEQTKDEKAEGLISQVGAKSGLGATIAEGLMVGRQLNVLMKKFYKNDPVKLSEWTTAYHIQRVGAKKKATPPPPPTP